MVCGKVVVVVGGEAVVLGDVDPGDASGAAEVGAVVAGDVVVVEVLGAEVVGVCVGRVPEDALDPGCSLATTIPMATVAPVATRAAKRVMCRSRASARRRVWGERHWGAGLIGRLLESESLHGSSAAS